MSMTVALEGWVSLLLLCIHDTERLEETTKKSIDPLEHQKKSQNSLK